MTDNWIWTMIDTDNQGWKNKYTDKKWGQSLNLGIANWFTLIFSNSFQNF